MQREDGFPSHTRRPHSQVDRHAIRLFGHLLVCGALLERRLTTSLRVGGRSPARRARRPPTARQIQRSVSSQSRNEER